MARFKIGQNEIDTDSNECHRENETFRVESKMMAVLSYLAEHRGEIISRTQLESEIWKDSVVGYDAVTSCIAKLRKVLGDDKRQPRYIETISKKGYRLIADVTPVNTLSHGKHNSRANNKWFYLSGIIVLAIAVVLMVSIQSGKQDKHDVMMQQDVLPAMLVLPFRYLSPDNSQDNAADYFAHGVYTDISTALSKLSGLILISPSTAENYQHISQPVPQSDLDYFSKKLGVSYLLQGSVRRDHSRLRINITLTDANRNVVIWSERYDRLLDKMFEVQDDITRNIIGTLKLKLSDEEKKKTAARYTDSIAAYEQFLKGQSHYIKHDVTNNLTARDHFNKALLLDDNFARAYSALALTYVAEHRYLWSSDPDTLKKALEYAQKATRIDQHLPHANWVLAYVYLFKKDYDNAARAAEHSIKIAPSYADSYISLAVTKLHKRQASEALKLVQKAMLINPDHPAAYSSILGQVYYFQKDYAAAEHALNNAIEKNINLLTPHIFLVATLVQQKRIDEAQWNASQISMIAPEFSVSDLTKLLVLQDKNVIKELSAALQSLKINQ